MERSLTENEVVFGSSWQQQWQQEVEGTFARCRAKKSLLDC
jgi:hypothetical protein